MVGTSGHHPSHSETGQIGSESSKWRVDLKHFHSDQAFIPIISARVNNAADWQAGWKNAGRCVDETCASVSEHPAWQEQHGGTASRSVCISRYSAHTGWCLAPRQGAGVPQCQKAPLSVLALLFLCLLFPSLPPPLHPRLTLFCSLSLLPTLSSSLPSVTPHLFSPPASRPAAAAAASCRGQLLNTSLPSGKPGVSCSFVESGKSEPLSSIYFIFVSTAAKATRDGVR